MLKYLGDKATHIKYHPEIRSEHLKVLLLNRSSLQFDLKRFYYEHLKRCKWLWLRLYFIRGYAMYATESEMTPVMQELESLLKRGHGHVDYSYILSEPLLPYLVKTYGYACCKQALATAKTEYEKVDPVVRGFFTLDENFEIKYLLSEEERKSRNDEYMKKNFGNSVLFK